MKTLERKHWIIAAVTSVVLAVTAYVIYAAASSISRGNDARAELTEVLAQQSALAAAYDGKIKELVEAAPDGVEKTVATTWMNCASSTPTTSATLWVRTIPSAKELDACEVSAVQLAEVRGFSRAAAASAVQRIRSLSLATYESATDDHRGEE